MTQRARKAVLQLLLGVVVVASLALIAAQLRRAQPALAELTRAAGAASRTVLPSRTERPEPPTRLESLPCFRCHNLGRYHKGKDFSHDQHREEGVGHCHVCHAFSGHFEVVVRRGTCDGCH